MSAPHKLHAGMVFHDKYQVIRWLGGGGFGHVYEVKHLRFRTDPLALKVAHDLEGEAGVASFFTEVDLLRRLHSRHIVVVRDAHVTPEGVCYFTTDLAPGASLDRLLDERGALEWRLAASIACQVLEALEEAHGESIVHRDVKPENVMVEMREGKDPFVRVLDFGIAKLRTRATGDGATRTVGTFAYMSPEQFRGEPADGRSDLYATAILLFECLTGQYVFDLPHEPSGAAYMYRHLQVAPRALRASRPDLALPPGLEEVIRRALEKDREARFPTAAAMRAALLEVVRSEEHTHAGPTPTPTPAPAATPAPAPPSSLGEVGPYVLERLLGAGQFGQVYRARHRTGSEVAALKLQKGDWLDDPVLLERFRREAEMAAMVRHPHAVSVLGHGEHEGRPYVAFEFVEGESLHDVLAAKGPLDPARAASIMRDVLDALAAIHEAGIIHRDIKPRNVLIARGGAAKVCDFGIGRVVAGAGAEAPRLTVAGDFIGTPAYAAPEMWRGDRIDARTDLYAVGVLLFEVLTGQRPFSATDSAAVMSAHLHAPPPRLSEARPALGQQRALEMTLARLLAKDPAGRFVSARDAWAALSVALGVHGRLTPLHPPASTPAAPAPTPPPATVVAPPGASRPPEGRPPSIPGEASARGIPGEASARGIPGEASARGIPGEASGRGIAGVASGRGIPGEASRKGGDTAPMLAVPTFLELPPPGSPSPWTIETHARLVTSDRKDFVIATPALRFGRDMPVGDPRTDNALVLRILPCRSPDLDPEGFRRTQEISAQHGELIVVDGRVALVDRSEQGIELEGSQVARDMIVPLPPRFRMELLGSGLVLVGRIFPESAGSARPGAVRLQRLGNASHHAYVWLISTAEIGTHGGPIPHPEEGSFGSALVRAEGRLCLAAPGFAPRPLVHGEQLRGRFETIGVEAARPEDMVAT